MKLLKNKRLKAGFYILVSSVMLLTSCDNNFVDTKENTPAAITTKNNPIFLPEQPALESLTEYSMEQDTEKLIVSCLDVGQGDCTLITLNDETLLIDAGNTKSGDKIVNYMQQQNIDDIDYFITTHPHADHIGSAVAVMNNYPVDILLMPDIEYTTRTYQNFITYISENNCQKIAPNQHDIYTLGDASFEILSPNNFPDSNINNTSIVVKLDYKDNSFLFMGDAEAPIENALIQDIGTNLKADVIRIGHHGSSSSTTENFMQYVSPEIAVISVGQNNQYGHPAQQVLNLLTTINTSVYRTDIDGTIILISDGKEIIVKAQDSDSNSNIGLQNNNAIADADPKIENDTLEDDTIKTVVYITKTGTKYYNSSCKYLKKSKIPIPLEDAKTNGYNPCSVCQPAA